MAMTYGYGVLVENEWATVDKILALLELAPKYKAECMKEIQDVMEDYEYSDIHDFADCIDDLLELFVNYDTDHYGLDVILCNVINEAERISLISMPNDGISGFLLFEIRAPWYTEPWAKEMSLERIENIFYKYVGMVTSRRSFQLAYVNV